MSDWYRSHHIPLNGVAIKMITIMTIKKYMKRLGNYDSYLVFNLEQLFHCHLFVLGDPARSVHTSEAAAAAVLIEKDVIKLDLHEGGAWRQHLIMALSNSSAPEGESEGRKEVWTSTAEQFRSCCAKHFKERPRSETKHCDCGLVGHDPRGPRLLADSACGASVISPLTAFHLRTIFLRSSTHSPSS